MIIEYTCGCWLINHAAIIHDYQKLQAKGLEPIVAGMHQSQWSIGVFDCSFVGPYHKPSMPELGQHDYVQMNVYVSVYVIISYSLSYHIIFQSIHNDYGTIVNQLCWLIINTGVVHDHWSPFSLSMIGSLPFLSTLIIDKLVPSGLIWSLLRYLDHCYMLPWSELFYLDLLSTCCHG